MPVPEARGTDETAERTRRRFQRRQWRRRWLAWRYIAAAVVLVVVFAGALYAVYFSSWLSIRGVEVTGTDTLSVDEVTRAAQVPEGDPLATVDLRAIRSRVEALEEVRAAEVTRKWPDKVLVQVEERVPVAVVEIGGTIRGVDETGVLFGEYRRAPDDLPIVRAGPDADSDSLREGATVVASLPDDLAERVVRLEVGSVDEIRLVLRDQRVVVWGSAADSDLKAEVLGGLLQQQAKVYDVSVPSRPTTSNEPARDIDAEG